MVLVHGFTQTLRSWDPVASTLARGHRVVTVDLPGHGGSGASRLAFEATARVLARVGPAAFVGYSMGGRLCLRVALDHPAAVSALVLLGASPGIPDPAVRRARLAEDDERARALERDGVETFVDRWLQGPLFETLPAAAAGREHRLVNRAEDLAAALDDVPYACGLGTATLLAADVVADPLVPRGGHLAVRRPQPDPELLDRYDVG